MNKKLTIKTKLLFSTLLIQGITFLLLSLGLYKALEISTFDKIQSNLRIITLDIIDDILDHKKLLSIINLDEAEEFRYKPLYIRIIELKSQKTIVKTYFPKQIEKSNDIYINLIEKKIKIEKLGDFIISRTKIKYKKRVNLIVEVATTQSTLNATLDSLFSILIVTIPIVFILSISGIIFLLNKSFSPVNNILKDLKNIKATNLSKRVTNTNSNDEIEQLIEEINSLLNRLESSFDKVQQFSADASHELKTPLTIIRGEIEVCLNRERTNCEYKDTLNKLTQEVQIIQHTIDDLLFLSKTEYINSKKEEIYLDEISSDSISELQVLADNKLIIIKNEIRQALSIIGHYNLLKIAIKNILKNAITFSPNNTKVLVKNYEEDGKAVISIKDEGIGISKEEQQKIFEKFYRTEKSRNKFLGGTGLGMSICKKIIDMHDAQIVIESEKEKGTNIIIKFPILKTN